MALTKEQIRAELTAIGKGDDANVSSAFRMVYRFGVEDSETLEIAKQKIIKLLNEIIAKEKAEGPEEIENGNEESS